MSTDKRMTHEGVIALRKAYAIACREEAKSYQRMLADYSYDNVDDHHYATVEKRRVERELAKASAEVAKCNLTTPA